MPAEESRNSSSGPGSSSVYIVSVMMGKEMKTIFMESL